MIETVMITQNKQNEWETALHAEFIFKKHIIQIPKGYKFDMATIPRMFWPFVGKHELKINGPLVHDFLYENKGIILDMDNTTVTYTRKEADLQFLKEMKEDHVPFMTRNIAYACVRALGATYYYT